MQSPVGRVTGRVCRGAPVPPAAGTNDSKPGAGRGEPETADTWERQRR
jgi:hypothetical protein